MKRFLAVMLGILITGGVLFAAAFGTYQLLNRSVLSPEEEQVLFTIERGESFSSISGRLKERGIISSKLFFRLLGKRNNDASRVKAGTYEIGADLDTTEILDLFVEGKQKLIKVTIPEGLSITRIAQILENKGILRSADFIPYARSQEASEEFGLPGDSLEGFLFPDTYFLPPDSRPDLAAEAMIDNFFDHLDEIYPGWEELEDTVFYNTVKLASIVEREYRVAAEAPLIASVFKNRLAVNMGLNSCATIEYIITEIKGRPHPEYLTYDDLQLESPYNTYTWAGLPPGPISNPGEVALSAAFKPADTDYWYFVLKDPSTGEHYFSEDSSEHNQARRLYLKSR